jgi:dTDP-4-amino-4,6-dideoxygalactose transaminase
MTTTVSFLNFGKKYRRYKKPIQGAIARVFDRGCFILGPEVREFEAAFANYLGVKHTIGVNSGTDAIFLALKASGLGRGDEVITVSNTATPTVSAIRMTGATPVFVDVLPKTHNLNPALLDRALTSKTRAIVPVHLYGLPANMKEILRFAHAHQLAVIEDVAQSQGARYRKQMAGTLGNAGCFSFYPTKNLGAFGDAGAVATNSDSMAEKIRALRNYGEVSKFNIGMEGVNSRMDEIQAALLSWGIQQVDEWNKRRAQIASIYLKSLCRLPLELPEKSDSVRDRVWHLFVVRTAQRDDLRKYLSENGVETMIHYPTPIHRQPAYRFLASKTGQLPVTLKLAERILSLPIYPELTDREIIRVCDTIKRFYGR